MSEGDAASAAETSLAGFLAARLDEDETAANAVDPLGHVFDMGGTRLDEVFSYTRIRFASEDGRARPYADLAAARHFARHDPGRVLREVAAGRAILDMYIPGARLDPGHRAVRHLAAVYSDHPDYRDEWKP